METGFPKKDTRKRKNLGRNPIDTIGIRPGEVLRSPPFWLMYAMFVMVGAGGLMLQAQLGPIAADLAIDKVTVSILGLTMLTPVFAVSVGQVTNGLSRPVFGWVSDWSGREHTMFVAFLLERSHSWP